MARSAWQRIYPIYLVHNPLAALITHLLSVWWVSFAAILSASVAAGLIYYFAYEHPALRMIRQRTKRQGSAEALSPP
jgi:peptidoglycan/LPS O-acetylase OafA/YrhL